MKTFATKEKTKDCICSLNSLLFTSWYENQKSDNIQSCVNSWYEPINIILDKIFWYNMSTVIVTNKKETTCMIVSSGILQTLAGE